MRVFGAPESSVALPKKFKQTSRISTATVNSLSGIVLTKYLSSAEVKKNDPLFPADFNPLKKFYPLMMLPSDSVPKEFR